MKVSYTNFNFDYFLNLKSIYKYVIAMDNVFLFDFTNIKGPLLHVPTFLDFSFIAYEMMEICTEVSFIRSPSYFYQN